MVLPSHNGRRMSPRSRNKFRSNNKARLTTGLTVFTVLIIALWACIAFVSPRLEHEQHSSNTVPRPTHTSPRNMKDKGRANIHHDSTHTKNGRLGGSKDVIGNNSKARLDQLLKKVSRKPRVIGMYAVPLNEDGQHLSTEFKKDRDRIRTYLPQYMYLTEPLDTNLLSHSSETLRRIRNHDFFSSKTPLRDFVQNYKLAISGSSNSYHIMSEDPLKNLMLSSSSRDTWRSITEDSEDYEGSLGK